MAQRRASFGMVVLVVTMAIVLLLVAKRWQQLTTPRQADTQVVDTDTLPGLSEAEETTDAYSAAVGDALEATAD